MDLALPLAPSPPPVAVMKVDQALPIVHSAAAADPLVVDGDAEGLVDAATVGLLDPNRLVLYSPSYQNNPAALPARCPADATLLVTDSNRLRPRSTTFLNNEGPTSQAGEQPLVNDPHNQPFDVFPGSTDASKTVLILRGAKSVEATSGAQPYGPIATRPSKALDGNVKTAWLVDGGNAVGPERLRIQFDAPITTDHINLVQPLRGNQNRWISGVTLSFDGHHAVHADLGDSSPPTSGQTVRFPLRTFSTLEIRIDNVHRQSPTGPQNAVGFAEIRVVDNAPGSQPVRVDENTRLPLDLLNALGSASINHALTFVMSRDTIDDTAMSRQLTLPTSRSFTLTGTAELGSGATDDALDTSLGLPDASAGGITATSSGRFNDPLARASSAIDGNLATAWNTPLNSARGDMEVDLPHTISFDHLDLHLVEDGRHSVPTRLRINSDNGTARVIDLTTLPHTSGPDGTVSLPAHFAAISGDKFTFTIVDIKPKIIKTPQMPFGLLMPSAIAELGIPGVQRAALPAQLPNTCMNNLVTVDGKPFPVRITGSTTDAVMQQPLAVAPCNAKATLKLSAGTHEIRAAETPYSTSGFDIEHLVLASGAGGAATPPALATAATPPSSADAPPIHVVHQSDTAMTLRVDNASKPFWLVFGQSDNSGWVAKANGHDLGKQQLVNGYANGWLVHPSADGKPITITVKWTPGRILGLTIPLSATVLVVCLGIVGAAIVLDRRRRVLATATAAQPTLIRSFTPPALDRRRGAVIGTTVIATVTAALLVNVWIAPLVGALTLVAVLRPRWHRAVRFAPAVIVGAIAIYVTAAQIVHHYAAVMPWPTYFDPARIPLWIALLLLGADALIAIAWRTDFGADENGDDVGDTEARAP